MKQKIYNLLIILKGFRIFLFSFLFLLILPNVITFAVNPLLGTIGDAARGLEQQRQNIQSARNDPVRMVMCNVIDFVKNLGLPIMTGVIIGSSVLAIFGRLAWPAIVMLVVFTAIFFGAGAVISKFTENLGVDTNYSC